jgi:hypothetical protein
MTRVVGIFFCTAAAFGAGVASDFAVGRAATAVEIRAAAVLSPLAIPFGTLGIDLPMGRVVFLVGGLLFWPLYGVLIWRILKAPRWWHWLALALWSAQGFFQIIHRLDAITSA